MSTDDVGELTVVSSTFEDESEIKAGMLLSMDLKSPVNAWPSFKDLRYIQKNTGDKSITSFKEQWNDKAVEKIWEISYKENDRVYFTTRDGIVKKTVKGIDEMLRLFKSE